MKLPFKITRNTEEPKRVIDEASRMDDFVRALTEAQGIAVSPTGTIPTIEAFDAFVAGMAEGGPSLRREITVDQIAERIRTNERSGMVVGIESREPCCALNAKDGMVLVTPSDAGVRRIIKKMPDFVERAFVTFYFVDAHEGEARPINLDAEACKKLMNALPGMIREAEDRRDQALAIVAAQ